MKKIIFVIPNLMHGGAERVLVNLVNGLDKSKFDVTLLSVFDCGVNKKDLSENVHYKFIYKKQFRGNSHYFKLFSPEHLYEKFIGSGYDIAVSFLEGISARIVSGCTDKKTKTVCWIHTSVTDKALFALAFRNTEEAERCYAKFDKLVFVSKSAEQAFKDTAETEFDSTVLYNPIDSDKITALAEECSDYPYDDCCIKICAVGKLIPVKGFDRLAYICKRLADEGITAHFYILGSGNELEKLEAIRDSLKIDEYFTLTGFLDNPYAVMKKCDLFVCSSYREGYSSAVCEALVCGVPVLTADVSGMREILGDGSGVICPNDDEAIYNELKKLITDPDMLKFYKEKACEKGKMFSLEKAIRAAEDTLENL